LTRGNVEEGFGFRLFFFVVDAVDVFTTKDDLFDGISDYAGLG
jgi:hypothetical protein